MTASARAGAAILTVVVAASAGAGFLTPHAPLRQFAGYENAPPMSPRVFDADGRLSTPFVYPLRLADRLERRYVEDRDRPMTIRWFAGGTLVSVDEQAAPWFPLGSDPLGRDVLARLLYGARLSLGVACLATLGAVALGLLVGGPAGFLGGRVDATLMALADFVLVLPAMFVVLAFRAALPLVLTAPQVFCALGLVLTIAGWPIAARGVRAIVASERRKEYAEAAYSVGASPLRILLRHLLPAAAPFLAVTATLLLPGFLLAEATLSLVGLGFPVPSATWGTMMREAWQGGAVRDSPWLLAPAAAVVVTVLGLHLLGHDRGGPREAAGTFS